jgi:hypothetical protein
MLYSQSILLLSKWKIPKIYIYNSFILTSYFKKPTTKNSPKKPTKKYSKYQKTLGFLSCEFHIPLEFWTLNSHLLSPILFLTFSSVLPRTFSKHTLLRYLPPLQTWSTVKQLSTSYSYYYYFFSLNISNLSHKLDKSRKKYYLHGATIELYLPYRIRITSQEALSSNFWFIVEHYSEIKANNWLLFTSKLCGALVIQVFFQSRRLPYREDSLQKPFSFLFSPSSLSNFLLSPLCL